MRRALPASLVVLGLASTAFADDALAPPVRLEAGGKAIDVEVGHAAPFVADWDHDGAPDLLVGQFGEGRLHIHRRTGKAEGALPTLAASDLFKAGGEIASIPAG